MTIMVYLMKENGILINAVTNNGKSSVDELHSMLLTGINLGMNEAFLGSIDHFVLTNGMTIFYRRFVINKIPFVMVVATDKSVNGSKGVDLQRKLVEFKLFLQEKNRWKIFQTSHVSSDDGEIALKMRDIFIEK